MQEDRRRMDSRLTSLQYLISFGFALLVVSFWALQVVQFVKFKELAENNHQRTLPDRAPRGMIFDRNGRVLVENRDSYSISIVREHTKNLPHTIQLLASVLGVPEADVQDIVDRHRKEPTFRPIVIVQDASLAQVAAVLARHLELPDVVVEEVPTRRYPDKMGAHLFGYVGEVTEKQVAENEDLRSGDIVGKAGIEQYYNSTLMGVDGYRKVVVNSIGREIPGREREEVQPIEGKRVKLTIDYDLQKALDDGFRASGFGGASVIMDPKTGEVLAFTSTPSYDPNAFASGIDSATWTSLITDKNTPMQNRAISGRFPPGSTFKMAVGTAALEEGVITPDFKVFCPGHGVFYGRSFQCSLPGGRGHGTIDLAHAIEKSCNVYFYTIGNMVGIDKIHKWATLLGLGEKTGIDLPGEVQGLVPSPEWKKAFFRRPEDQKWYAGETISVSIGQGANSLTPISQAVYISTLANGGTRQTPHLLKAINDGSGWKDGPAPAPHSVVHLKPETLAAIGQGLWMVVNEAGTGRNARIPGRDVSGKTGTAQVISLDGSKAARGRTDRDLRDNGWFVFYAPRDNPQIAGAIIVEHGGHGGTTAAPIAKHVLDTFFAKQDGLPVPVLKDKEIPGAPADGDEPIGPDVPVGPVRNVGTVANPGTAGNVAVPR